ncbi:MAG: alanine racemase [Thermoflexus sp.]|uniref:alanine racemase n=1 Tax=Thermoflexus sp. TaxID=1969742 RepID=UPI00331CD9A7
MGIETGGWLTWAEVDLDAIAANVRAMKRWVGDPVEVIAVVKADAYGHGAAPVARAALQAGAARLAVHRLAEGVALRQAGIEAPILILAPLLPEEAPAVLRWQLTPTVSLPEAAEALDGIARAAGQVVPVHLEVDTGMGRAGLRPEEAVPLARALQGMVGLRLEGLYTHFATADEPDPSFVRAQLRRFEEVLAALTAAGIRIPLRHVCNSAAAMRFPEAHFEAVRPGLALYGMRPSLAWEPPFPLRPALSWKSRILRVWTLRPGESVGYGRTFVAPREMRAALVAVGYGDGYLRSLSNRGAVLIRRRRAPVLGRVSMDQIVVDVTGIPGVTVGEEVVLIGAQGGAVITAEEVAAWAGTINYEITTRISARVPRLYRAQGEVREMALPAEGMGAPAGF